MPRPGALTRREDVSSARRPSDIVTEAALSSSCRAAVGREGDIYRIDRIRFCGIMGAGGCEKATEVA